MCTSVFRAVSTRTDNVLLNILDDLLNEIDPGFYPFTETGFIG